MPRSFRKGRVLSWSLSRKAYELAKAMIATGRVPYMSIDELIRDGIRAVVYRGVVPPPPEALEELIESLDRQTRRRRKKHR